jgi:hypothetical protein
MWVVDTVCEMFGRNRRANIRSIDEMRTLGRMSRVLMPAAPSLEPGETVLFDFSAQRHLPGLRWRRVLTPWGRDSRGRLTLTDRRLVFSIYKRDPRALWLAKVPSDLGDVEFALAEVTHIGKFPWWNLFGWFPGATTADIVLSGGERYFFSQLAGRQWHAAMQSLAEMYPQLVEDGHE